MRQETNGTIRQAGDPTAQVDLIQDVVEMFVDGTEIANEIITEAWGMLMDDGLWRARFASKQEASKALDSTILQDIRKRATANRGRKEKAQQTQYGLCDVHHHHYLLQYR